MWPGDVDPDVFALEPGLRYRVDDPVLAEPSPWHQETKFFAFGDDDLTVLYEARSRFAYEVTGPREAVLWRLAGSVRTFSAGEAAGAGGTPGGSRFAVAGLTGGANWECDPSHVLRPAQLRPGSQLVPPSALADLGRAARAAGGGGTPPPGLAGVELRDGRSYFDPAHRHWRAACLRGGWLRRPVWVLYEVTEPGLILEALPDGRLRLWRGGPPSLAPRTGPWRPYERDPAAESFLLPPMLRDMKLAPVERSPGMPQLMEAIRRRRRRARNLTRRTL